MYSVFHSYLTLELEGFSSNLTTLMTFCPNISTKLPKVFSPKQGKPMWLDIYKSLELFIIEF